MLFPKNKPWQSAAYRKFVASLPCLLCGQKSEAHHEQEQGQGVMGGKVGDEHCLPLCPICHMERHLHGRAIWQDWNIDTHHYKCRIQAAWELMGNKIGERHDKIERKKRRRNEAGS